MEQEVRSQRLRYHEIDLLRFLAAFVVLLFHYTFRGYAADHLSPVHYPLLENIFKYGNLGVELFFIISGYVVLMSAYNKTVRQFSLSHVVRLYPAFWVACTITFSVMYLFGPAKGMLGWSIFIEASIKKYILNMTMLQQFFGAGDLDGVYWTLSYEIIFYFLISLLLAYQLMRYLIFILGGWLLYSAYAGFAIFTSPFATLLLPAYGPFFIAGMLFYLLQQKMGNAKQLYGLLIGSWVLAVRHSLAHAKDNAEYYHTSFSPLVIAVLISLFYLLFLLIIFRKIDLYRYKWLSWLGSLTYPLYLLHHNLGDILFQRLGGKTDKYVLLIGIILFMLLLAYLLHVYVEKRFSTYLRSWIIKQLNRLDRHVSPL